MKKKRHENEELYFTSTLISKAFRYQTRKISTEIDVLVQIPIGAVAGGTLSFLGPDAKLAQVVIPLGCFAGHSINVRFPVPVDYKVNKASGGRDDSNHIGSQILVVGEGNFSFTRALCYLNRYNEVFGNLWSTSKDDFSNNQR